MTAVQRQEDRANRLLKSATDRDITEQESAAWVRDCDVSGGEGGGSAAGRVEALLQGGWRLCGREGGGWRLCYREGGGCVEGRAAVVLRGAWWWC